LEGFRILMWITPAPRPFLLCNVIPFGLSDDRIDPCPFFWKAWVIGPAVLQDLKLLRNIILITHKEQSNPRGRQFLQAWISLRLFIPFPVRDSTTDNAGYLWLAPIDFAHMGLEGALQSIRILVVGKVIGHGGRPAWSVLEGHWRTVFKASYNECPRALRV